MSNKKVGCALSLIIIVFFSIGIFFLLFYDALFPPDPPYRIICANNLKQIGMAMKMYADEHDETFPGRFAVIGRYVSEYPRLFICPTSGNAAGTFETVDEWTDYVYISGLSETNSPSEILMYCPIENHGGEGGNILFLDGHVEWLNSEENTSGETSFENAIGTIGKELKP